MVLPPLKSDLAKAVFKDPYNLGFVDMSKVKQESDSENQLARKVTEIDDLLKMPEDNPTIGLLLCRSKNDTKVEYALRGITQPLGVASYETRQIIEDIRSSVEAYLASDNIG